MNIVIVIFAAIAIHSMATDQWAAVCLAAGIAGLAYCAREQISARRVGPAQAQCPRDTHSMLDAYNCECQRDQI